MVQTPLPTDVDGWRSARYLELRCQLLAAVEPNDTIKIETMKIIISVCVFGKTIYCKDLFSSSASGLCYSTPSVSGQLI